MNADRIVLLALWIESVPRPTSSPAWLDLARISRSPTLSPETPCLTHVLRAQTACAAGCDMDPGLAVRARPIAEIGLRGKRDAARADRQKRRQCAMALRNMRLTPHRSPSRPREQPMAPIRLQSQCRAELGDSSLATFRCASRSTFDASNQSLYSSSLRHRAASAQIAEI